MCHLHPDNSQLQYVAVTRTRACAGKPRRRRATAAPGAPCRREPGYRYARDRKRNDPKHKPPAGFRKSHVLFNIHRVAGPDVIVVGGFFDCMKVWQSEQSARPLTAIYRFARDGDGGLNWLAQSPIRAMRRFHALSLPRRLQLLEGSRLERSCYGF
jgi:hypothetical protein